MIFKIDLMTPFSGHRCTMYKNNYYFRPAAMELAFNRLQADNSYKYLK
jgi:hypothetical protein